MKPDDIPQEAWESAFHNMDNFGFISAFYTDEDEQKIRICISRAILSERERCAKVAERKWRGAPMYPDGADIAVDIRTGEQP